MGSEQPDQVNSSEQVRQSGEDDLLGVIADVERQLENLKSHRAERDTFRQRLEAREEHLTQRDRDLKQAEEEIKERYAQLKAEEDRGQDRLKEVDAAEAELARRREKLESDFAALAEEQRRASEAAAREAAEAKAITVALEQREQRLSEHAANISRQRETFEAMSAELQRRQESAASQSGEVEKARAAAAELKARLDESERQGTSRGAELDQVRQRAVDLEKRVAELSKSTDETRRQAEDQTTKLAEQLRVAKDEVKRAGEAQSALMAEIAQRDKAAEESQRERELLRAEAGRRQTTQTEAETRLNDFKRQVIDRDTRIQELSSKLSAATAKFRDVSSTLQEQAALAGQVQTLVEDLKIKDREIAELRAANLKAGEAGSNGGDVEALENQLQQMQAQLEEAREANRELKDRVPQQEGGIPEEIAEAVISRWKRLRLMRNLLREQGQKLREAGEAIRARYAQAEQLMAQRDQLAHARTAMASAQEKLQKLQARAAISKAGTAMFYFVGALAGMAGLAWAISGEVTPSRYAARTVINADTRGRQTSEDQLVEWQKYIESQIHNPQMHEVAADRMARAGIVSLSTPGQLAQKLDKDLVVDSAMIGSIKLEMQGQGKAKAVRELDTFMTALVSEANATKERRPDGLGVLIAEKVNADAGALDASRVTYAGIIFGVGTALCFGMGGYTFARLAKAKVRIEEEQTIDDILENSNWKRAEEIIRAGRG